jgi:signal transduction histidine kinase
MRLLVPLNKSKSMKKILLSFLFLVISGYVVSSANEGLKSNDSLLKIINQKKYDIAYLDALTSYAENVRAYDPDSSMNMLKESLKLSKKLDFQSGIHSSLLILAYIQLQKGDVDLSLYYLDEAMKVAEQIDSISFIANTYRSYGDYYEDLKQKDKGLEYYKKALKIYDELDDEYRKASIYNNMARCYDEQNEADIVLEYYLKALNSFRKLNKTEAIAVARANIGTVYMGQEDWGKAKSEILAASKINLKINNENILAGNYMNLGIIYRRVEEADSSLYYFDKAIDLYTKHSDQFTLIQVHFNKGQLLTDMDSYDSAVYEFEKAISISNKLNFDIGQAYCYYGLGNCYNEMENYELALESMFKGLEFSTSMGISDLESGSYYLVYDISKKINDNKTALEYFEKYTELEDSLNSLKNESKYENLSLQYENEKMMLELQKKTDLAHHKDARNKLYLVLLSLATILLVIIIIVSLNLSRQRQIVKQQNHEIKAKNTRLKELDDFKDATISMMVHDLKNPLNAIISITEDEDLEIEDSRGVINMAGNRMHNIVMNILDVNKYKEVGMSISPEMSNLQDIFDDVLLQVAYLSQRRNVTIENYITERVNVYGDVHVLGRVFSNLILNAIKYSNENSSIFIRYFYKMEGGSRLLGVSIEDEGIGIEANNLKRIFNEYLSINPTSLGVTYATGIGLTYCKMAVEAHKGTITAESISSRGTIINVFLPVH